VILSGRARGLEFMARGQTSIQLPTILAYNPLAFTRGQRDLPSLKFELSGTVKNLSDVSNPEYGIHGNM